MLWWRDARVYLATRDSVAGPPGTRLTFVSRGRTIATGEIERVVDGELVVARLTSGSLAKEKKPDRIAVLAEPPALPRLLVLRVGYPASGRAAALFTCVPTTLRPPPGVRLADAASDRSWRWVRDDSAAVAPPTWPDTLEVRLFHDAADEEIALERGEIDAAVFWPGELSSHMREHARGQGMILARTRGIVVAAGLAAGDSTALAAFNRDLFRGDLLGLPWSAPAAAEAARLEVDAAWSGRPAIERAMARVRGTGTRPLRLSFIEAPGRSSIDVASVPVFAVRCPVVGAPALRTALGAIAQGLVGALDCAPGSPP